MAQLPRKPQERLLEVEVRQNRNIEVLQVLLAVERDEPRLYLTLNHVHFVPHEHDRHCTRAATTVY